MTANPTPEPGQRIWIAARAVQRFNGTTVLEVEQSDADGVWRSVVDPEAVVWHPADVPPQPPVLARCWSCGHEPEMHQPEGCWYTVEQGTPGRDLVCPCTVPRQPVQATTHGEAGEAQEGAQAAPRVANSSTGANGSLTGASPANLGWAAPTTVHLDEPKPAVQGAGRDWRGEIEVVLAKYTSLAKLQARALAGTLRDALGLHDLEQAAAERRGAVSLADHILTGVQDILDRRDERLDAEDRANAAKDEQFVRRLLRGIVRKALADYGDSLKDAQAERDAARRELEQLRGEVGKIADDCNRRSLIPALHTVPAELWYVATPGAVADKLRAALAAGAPATQDGADHG